jgi:hypothetical protein
MLFAENVVEADDRFAEQEAGIGEEEVEIPATKVGGMDGVLNEDEAHHVEGLARQRLKKVLPHCVLRSYFRNIREKK